MLKNTLKAHLNPLKALLVPLLVGFSRFPLKALTGKKADSPGNFWERNLIFLLAFIFMICLANLITILFLINIFL